jgi:hypothetical protein
MLPYIAVEIRHAMSILLYIMDTRMSVEINYETNTQKKLFTLFGSWVLELAVCRPIA